ncbi:MAG: retroviral-like aspartic protease family protein [Candidatus Altiarchaeota archaeon]
MKVPLAVNRTFGEWMLYAHISIRSCRVNPVPIRVLVDTGSPWLAISPKDAKQLNMPISSLTKPKESPKIWFGGHIFYRLLLDDVTIHLKEEDGEIVSVEMPSVSVLQPTKKAEEVNKLPSVLGCDFLRVGNFSLFFDTGKQAGFLER